MRSPPRRRFSSPTSMYATLARSSLSEVPERSSGARRVSVRAIDHISRVSPAPASMRPRSSSKAMPRPPALAAPSSKS